MHQQLVNQYADIMASLDNLPGEIAAVQTDLNAAKAQLAISDRTLADIEAQTALNVEGKNAEERKARLTQALKADAVYVRWSKAADVERSDVAKLSNDVDMLTRQFAAVGYAARLTAATMEMLAAMGPNKAGDIEFHMDAAGKSAAQLARVTNGSNGHMTAQDAADAGL
jgi:multidrug efflux pump subunit AcrA (membrane-fusion protein)